MANKSKFPHIEVVTFGIMDGHVNLEIYNRNIEANIEMIVKITEDLEKWAADEGLNHFEINENQNGEHVQSVGEVDIKIWIREEMKAEDFINYLKQKGGVI